MDKVAQTIKTEGPFDGVIGFSQGGALAGMTASVLEEGRVKSFARVCEGDSNQLGYPSSFLGEGGNPIQPPLSFCIIYSGFRAPSDHYEGFYTPALKTKMCIFIGSLDTVVDETRVLALVDACEGKERRVKVCHHVGGHFLPGQKIYLDAAVGFIRDCIAGVDEKTLNRQSDESVENMDGPF